MSGFSQNLIEIFPDAFCVRKKPIVISTRVQLRLIAEVDLGNEMELTKKTRCELFGITRPLSTLFLLRTELALPRS